MRGLAAAVLLGAMLAGCSGGKGPNDAPNGGPVSGLEAALAAAQDWAADARLLALEGMENPVASTQDDDGEPLPPFFRSFYGAKDPAVGDGNASAWLWTFSSEGEPLPRYFMTQGSRVVGQQTVEDWRVEEDLHGLVPFDVEGLYLDTPAMAAILARDHPGWADGTFAHGGVHWMLAADAGGPRWRVDGELDDGDSGFIRAFYFDAHTGVPVATPERAGGTLPSLQPSLRLADCTNFGGVFPVPMDAARAALPEGFEPVPTPSDPGGGATLYVIWAECRASSVDGNDTGPASVMYAELAVVPPDDIRVAGIDDYTVPLAMGASQKAVGERLAKYRLGRAGQSTLSDVTDGSPGPRIVRMTVDGVTMDLRGQVSPQAGAAFGSGSFALVGVQEGAVRTVIVAQAEGGTPSDAALAFQGAGIELFDAARPVVRGFSVAGFTLTFRLAAGD